MSVAPKQLAAAKAKAKTVRRDPLKIMTQELPSNPPEQKKPAQKTDLVLVNTQAADGESGELNIEELRALARNSAIIYGDAGAAESERKLGPGIETKEDVFASAIKKAERPDCRTTYSGGEKANLLALIPIVINTVREKGCKW